jgi:tetratricopeptide (TPR) repeat protein
VLKTLGNYEGAKELLEKAVKFAEKNLGVDHPTTAISYSNLAIVLQALGNYEGAKELLEKTVSIFKNTLPIGHPYIKQAEENLRQRF